MKLLDALKGKSGIRVVCGWRWLVVDDYEGFVVYEQVPYKKEATVVITTKDEEEAVNALVA